MDELRIKLKPIFEKYGVECAFVFGSVARGEATRRSDIDLIVVAPVFDTTKDIEVVKRLWRATSIADSRIEPIACGEKEWETDDGRPILEIARREGIVIETNAGES